MDARAREQLSIAAGPFSVNSHSRGVSYATAILFERSARGSVDIAHVAAQFKLTEREQETVGFLIEGLTSKEIAAHMNISPNTVKAFIRLVMIKMDVSTRSGIVGKIVKTVSTMSYGLPYMKSERVA